jgi:hypothetical protein
MMVRVVVVAPVESNEAVLPRCVGLYATRVKSPKSIIAMYQKGTRTSSLMMILMLDHDWTLPFSTFGRRNDRCRWMGLFWKDPSLVSVKQRSLKALFLPNVNVWKRSNFPMFCTGERNKRKVAVGA